MLGERRVVAGRKRLLTATAAPRLNVDNGFKIWRYNGELLHHAPREKLYEATRSPRPRARTRTGPSPREASAGKRTPWPRRGRRAREKGGAVPPAARDERFGQLPLAEAAPEDAGPAARPPGAAASGQSKSAKQPSGPPGATFITDAPGQSKSAAKNAKKRAAAKAKKEAAAAAAKGG